MYSCVQLLGGEASQTPIIGSRYRARHSPPNAKTKLRLCIYTQAARTVKRQCGCVTVGTLTNKRALYSVFRSLHERPVYIHQLTNYNKPYRSGPTSTSTPYKPQDEPIRPSTRTSVNEILQTYWCPPQYCGSYSCYWPEHGKVHKTHAVQKWLIDSYTSTVHTAVYHNSCN